MRRTVQIVAIVNALKVCAHALALDALLVLAERGGVSRKDPVSMGWQRLQTVVGAVGK